VCLCRESVSIVMREDDEPVGATQVAGCHALLRLGVVVEPSAAMRAARSAAIVVVPAISRSAACRSRGWRSPACPRCGLRRGRRRTASHVAACLLHVSRDGAAISPRSCPTSITL
jgi:hypothetical protein